MNKESESEASQGAPVSSDVELYGDPGISSCDGKVPTFLKCVYMILPIWGVLTWCIFWNGSVGWFDRGAWKELQIAANTTFPIENQNMLPQNLEPQKGD
jgi:hypothetical protein